MHKQNLIDSPFAKVEKTSSSVGSGNVMQMPLSFLVTTTIGADQSPLSTGSVLPTKDEIVVEISTNQQSMTGKFVVVDNTIDQLPLATW